MKEQKKLIIVIISIIILLLIVAGITYIIIKNNNTNTITSNNIEISDEEQANVKDQKEYHAIISIVNDYINTTNYNSDIYFDNEGNRATSEEDINKRIYSLLDKEYIKQNNIDENNVKKYINEVKQNIVFLPINMQVIKKANIQKYFIYGIMQNILKSNETQEISMYVIVDDNTKAYSIIPCIKTISDYNNLKIVNDETSIEKNENNAYEESDVTQEDIAQDYITNYKRMMLINAEKAYSYLDDNYKKEKFDTLEKFKNYINVNKTKIANMTLAQYKITELTNNNEQIVCIDKNDNYYVFNENKEKGILEYKVYLDDYTVNLADFDTKYYQADGEEKAKLDVRKIQEALKVEDFNYIYKQLSTETLKENKIKTEADFEKYIKSKIGNKNEINITKITENSGKYDCIVTISDGTNKIDATITIEPKTESSFVITFKF